MIKIINLLLLLSLVTISSCTRITAVTNNNDNFAQKWEKVGSSEAQISFRNNEDKVVYRRALDFDDKTTYVESLALDNGSIVYAKYNNANISNDIVLVDILKNKVKNTNSFKENQYTLIDSSIVKKNIGNNKLVYGLLKSPNKPNCLLFITDNKLKSSYEIAFGTYCNNGNKNDNELIDSIVNNVVFDNGNHARNHLFAKANKELEKIKQKSIKLEKNSPIVVIDGVWLVENSLVVKGNINDDSGINAVWLNGTLINASNGDFFVNVKNSSISDSIELIAIDIHNNYTKQKLTLSDTKHPDLSQADLYDLSDSGKRYALIIALDDYKNTESDFDLDSPINDATVVNKVLKDNLGFQTSILRNPTEKSFRDTMGKLEKTLNPNDKVIIYYSGHGYLYPENASKDKQDSYWLMSDFSFDSPESWVSDKELKQIFSRIPAKEIMLISDSCYSGRLSDNAVFSSITNDNSIVRTVLTSGSDQPVPDSFDRTNSHFALSVVKTLRANNKKLIGSELHKQIVQTMLDEANFVQEPQYGELVKEVHTQGSDFILAR